MALTVTIYNSTADFTNYIEQTIAETKSLLAVHMTKIEEIRKKYEKSKKRYESLKKLTGGKTDILKDTKQLDVAGFKVLVNPTADYELKLWEEAIGSLQEKLQAFEKATELFPVLTDENMKIGIVLNDGIPTGFMLYMQE